MINVITFWSLASVAFASPPVQDEKLPDQVVKVPVVEKEPTVEHTEAEAGPLVQDEAVVDSRLVEPDSEHTVAEAGPLVQDEAVVDSRLVEPDSEHTVAEAGPLVQDEAVADSRLVEPDSVLLEPETTEEQRVPEETQVMFAKPVLEADYLTEETSETEVEPEPEITAIQTDRNIVSVEEAVAELESETNTEVEDEKEENVVKDEPTLEADYITAEDPEIQMEPGRERWRTQIGKPPQIILVLPLCTNSKQVWY